MRSHEIKKCFLTLQMNRFSNRKYTTELSKGQGMVEETIAILGLWEPGMSVVELKSSAIHQGILGRATALRVRDIVGRVFAARYLTNGSQPAYNLKRLLKLNFPAGTLNQILLIYTARAHHVLHDFICDAYWRKYEAGATHISTPDAVLFLRQSIDGGIISPPWSETMILRVGRYLTGCLSDFKLAGEDHRGSREIIPFRITSLTALYLAFEIHFSGVSDDGILCHNDWHLFGLGPMDIRRELEYVSNGHFITQFSGELLRISWHYKTMEEALDGIATAEL